MSVRRTPPPVVGASAVPERAVLLRPRTVMSIAGVLLGLALALWVVWLARQVVEWIFIAIFFALALNPAVNWLQRRGVHHRGTAAGIIYLITVAALVGLGFLLIPPLVDQIRGLADAAPGYVHDLTKGKGPLGFLETKYHIVERVREATRKHGGSPVDVAGGAQTALSITRGIVTGVVAVVTIAFLTFFMIVEGPAWSERIYGMLPAAQEQRWRTMGQRIGETVSGYVTGNLVISLIAGGSITVVLLIVGVPYALALGILVAILDLVPLAGATIAGIIVATVAFLTSITAGIVVVAFIVVYQQLENHLLQPVIYGRTVQLSPLAVLVAVLVGAAVLGVIGALAAIPVAGTLQIILRDWRDHRPRATDDAALPVPADPG